MLRNSWAGRGEPIAALQAGCEQWSYIPEPGAPTAADTLSSPLSAPDSTAGAVGRPAQPGSCTRGNEVLTTKRGIAVRVVLRGTGLLCRGFCRFSIAQLAAQLERHRCCSRGPLEMRSVLPLAAGLALARRSAGALSNWSLKTCEGRNGMTSPDKLFLLPGLKLPGWSLWPLPLLHHLLLLRPSSTPSTVFPENVPERLRSPSLELLWVFDILVDWEAQRWTAIFVALPQ